MIIMVIITIINTVFLPVIYHGDSVITDGSNSIKHLIPASEAWRQERHRKLYLVNMDYIYGNGPFPAIAQICERFLEVTITK